jgi:hypothetical protein
MVFGKDRAAFLDGLGKIIRPHGLVSGDPELGIGEGVLIPVSVEKGRKSYQF